MPHLLVHSPDGGCLGGLHAFVSNATANTGMRVLVLFLSDSHPEVELLGHMKVKSLSRVQLFATLWTVAYQAPLSMGLTRQEYWSGLLFPPPGIFPTQGIEFRSPALQADSLSAY